MHRTSPDLFFKSLVSSSRNRLNRRFIEGPKQWFTHKKGHRSTVAFELLGRKAVLISGRTGFDQATGLSARHQIPVPPKVISPFSNISIDTRSPPFQVVEDETENAINFKSVNAVFDHKYMVLIAAPCLAHLDHPITPETANLEGSRYSPQEVRVAGEPSAGKYWYFEIAYGRDPLTN